MHRPEIDSVLSLFDSEIGPFIVWIAKWFGAIAVHHGHAFWLRGIGTVEINRTVPEHFDVSLERSCTAFVRFGLPPEHYSKREKSSCGLLERT